MILHAVVLDSSELRYFIILHSSQAIIHLFSLCRMRSLKPVATWSIPHAPSSRKRTRAWLTMFSRSDTSSWLVPQFRSSLSKSCLGHRTRKGILFEIMTRRYRCRVSYIPSKDRKKICSPQIWILQTFPEFVSVEGSFSRDI